MEIEATVQTTEAPEGSAAQVSNQESGNVDSSAQEIALQERQMSDEPWFDDGIGAVVDSYGNPKLNKNGQPFASMEDYQKAQSAKPEDKNIQQPEIKAGMPQKPIEAKTGGFESFYSKDKGFDFETLAERIGNSGKTQYSSTLLPKVDPSKPVAEQSAITQKTEEQELSEFEAIQTKTYLDPMKKLYGEISATLTPEADQAFRNAYSERVAEIDKSVSSKQWEITRRMVNSNRESTKFEFDMKETERASNVSIGKAVVDMLPKEGMNGFWQLVVGHQGAKGFVRGPGADLVDLLFDMSNEGKTFKNTEEWNKAYQNWFLKFTSSETNVRNLIKHSLNAFSAGNITKYRDMVRQTAQKEEQNKKKLLSPTPMSGRASIGNETLGDDLQTYLSGKPASRV